MSLKTIDQNPKVTDTIRFLIETPDVDGCFVSDPYKVNNVTIYYVERDFVGQNWGEYEKVSVDAKIQAQIRELQAELCSSPSTQTAFEITKLQNELESKTQRNKYYYNDAKVVIKFGNDVQPAWFSGDDTEAVLTKTYKDANGATVTLGTGQFYLDWSPNGQVREGDFFICWTWTPLPAGDALSDHINFNLWGDGKAVQTLPIHTTPEGKYETLLEKYLPELYKANLVESDLTPRVTDNLNKSVAAGFTVIEDLANQIIDLYDANVIHESLIVYLANTFDLKLKSNDPTLWRRQVKEAVPLFKKKGTLRGLEEAFSQSGMTLDKYTSLWQVVSNYTWQESFVVKSSPTFKLEKAPITDIDLENFGLWIRRSDEDEYVEVDHDSIIFSETNCEHFFTWVGDEKSVNSISLFEGDIIRILYQYAEIPSGEQAVEDYVRALSLADTRDELDQENPPKNWNVRLIEEDDPLFDVVVPVRHPFHDLLIFGQIRTEFPFSENIYNMETYNGSTRDSTDACFIDKTFRDPCGNCFSSKYNLDLSVGDLSDDRLREVYDILDEYTPFTSVPHNLNFLGELNDFVRSPVEEIEFLVQINLVEFVISGGGNSFFNRVMEDGLAEWQINRDMLAAETVLVSNRVGTAYNSAIALISPDVKLADLGLDIYNHIFEVLSPSPNSGIYNINRVEGNTGTIASGVVEPINTSAFTFRLSNVVLDASNLNIEQANYVELIDVEESFGLLSIKSVWDVENTPDYTGGPWKIHFPDYSVTLEIQHIIANKLYLETNDIPTLSSVSYTLLDDTDNEILVSLTGNTTAVSRGLVTFTGGFEVEEFLQHGNWMLYDGDEYRVLGFPDDNKLWISEYSDGEASGVSAKFLKRLVTSDIGYFEYQGLKLQVATDYESEFGILNGSGTPETDEDFITDNSLFKENFLIKIDDYYYKLEDIKGTEIILSGYPQNWGTLSAGGTSVSYDLHHFENDTVETKFVVFDQIDRRGKDVIVREIESNVTNDVAISALSMTPGHGIQETVMQEEDITFEIQYSNGDTEKGTVV